MRTHIYVLIVVLYIYIYISPPTPTSMCVFILGFWVDLKANKLKLVYCVQTQWRKPLLKHVWMFNENLACEWISSFSSRYL